MLRGSKTDNFSNFLEISEMIESASKILSQAEFISCDGLDQVRGEVVKLAEDIAHEMIELLHEELFLGDTDLSSLLVEFSRNDELLKERLMNLLNGLYRLQYSSVSGSYCNSNYQQQLVALMERCIAEARELYLRRSPVARIEDEPRGYDLLSRSDLIPSFPILWRDLAEEDSRRIDIFVKVLTSAFLEVLRRFRLVKDSISKLEDEDTYPTSRTVWLWMQRIVVVELGYMLETEFPDIEYHDSANALYSPMNSLHLRPKGIERV